MARVYLVLAGLFEIGFAGTLKPTEGFTKFWPSVIFLFCTLASFFLLARAARDIPISTAYLVWSGIGVGGAALFGILVYNEPSNALRLFFIATLIASIIGLKLATPS